MIELVWSPGFTRGLKRLVRKSPNLREPIEATLTKLAEDPFQPSLSTHKLKGDLADRWACSVHYSDWDDTRGIAGDY